MVWVESWHQLSLGISYHPQCVYQCLVHVVVTFYTETMGTAQ